jgi:hypothetical protein
VQDRGNVALPMDTVKLLKTQDENYVRTQRAIELNVSYPLLYSSISSSSSRLTTMLCFFPSAENRTNQSPTLLPRRPRPLCLSSFLPPT